MFHNKHTEEKESGWAEECRHLWPVAPLPTTDIDVLEVVFPTPYLLVFLLKYQAGRTQTHIKYTTTISIHPMRMSILYSNGVKQKKKNPVGQNSNLDQSRGPTSSSRCNEELFEMDPNKFCLTTEYGTSKFKNTSLAFF